MYRYTFLLLMPVLLSVAAPACAENLLPALAFSDTSAAHRPAAPVPEAGRPLAGLNEPEAMALRLHAQRDEMRERLLEAVGLARFIPRGHFSTLGYDTRWSLNLHVDRSVTLNLGVRW